MRLKVYLVGAVSLVLCAGLIAVKAETIDANAVKSISTNLEELQSLLESIDGKKLQS